MKVKLLLLLCFFANKNCFAQESNIWGNISRSIYAKPYAGKKFQIQAAIKVILIDKKASAGIWAWAYKSNKKLGVYKNMSPNPVKLNEWKTYSISGIIDKDAATFSFGINYAEKGVFYFDDIRLFIEDDAGVMQQIPMVNGDFEEDSLQTKYSWWYNKEKNVYNISLTDQDVYSGKKSCKVDGTILRSTLQYGDNDTAGKYTTANGVKIYYEEYGSGEPLLLLHGNSQSINSFRQQIPELSKFFHVYAMDTRGHGKSGDEDKTYTYDLFAADMKAFLDDQHLDSVNILGWSDGGNTGLIMAMKYPQKVKRLITMGAVIFINNSVVDKWVFNTLNKEKKELVKDSTTYTIGRLRRIELLLTEPKHTFEELASISCPVLVMAGEKDVVKEVHTIGIASHITNASLLIVPKATHELPWEDAPYFNKKILEFLHK